MKKEYRKIICGSDSGRILLLKLLELTLLGLYQLIIKQTSFQGCHLKKKTMEKFDEFLHFSSLLRANITSQSGSAELNERLAAMLFPACVNHQQRQWNNCEIKEGLILHLSAENNVYGGESSDEIYKTVGFWETRFEILTISFTYDMNNQEMQLLLVDLMKLSL